ncbi:MAG TPA: glutaredoxin family protein [bacterium]|nr:glutaredoxin family protein [bacterium]
MSFTRVEGEHKGDVRMFTLSTCIWCKKTKQFLKDNNVEYEYLDLDKLEKAEKDKYIEELRKWNERCSLPTMVINQETCIVGFKEDQIREALKI